MTAKTYNVTVTPKLANGFNMRRQGDVLEISASNRNDAIKAARREMSNRGYDRHDGGFTYTAKVAS